MPDMTAAEAIHAIRECAYYAGAGVTHSPALMEEAGCAEEAIREAFEVLEVAEEWVGGGSVSNHAAVFATTAEHLLNTARARLEAKPDADEC